MPGDVLLWTYGFGPKSPAAIAEAERVLGARLTDPNHQIPDYRRDTHERLRSRWSTAPRTTLIYPAMSVRAATAGAVIRCRERGVKAKQVVFEDHGLPGLIFVGADVVTLRTLPDHRESLRLLRQCLARDAEVVLLHCQVTADGGELAKALSREFGCPVTGMDVDQVIGNRQFEGIASRCTEAACSCIGAIDRAVLHFD